MTRYIPIYLQLLKLNFSIFLEYRANFFSSLFSSVGWGVLSIITMFLLTLRIKAAFGWSREELIIIAAFYPIFSAIFYMFFAGGIGRVPEIINRGELDFILIRPINSQFYLSCFWINFYQIFRILACLAFIIVYIHITGISVSFLSIFNFIFFFIVGLALLYSIWFGVITISLWNSTLTNLKDFLFVINGSTRYPQDMYQGQVRRYLFFLLPFAYVLSVPVKAIVGKADVISILILVILSLVFFIFAKLFWQFALRFYTSASG